jgi:ABC-type sulfate/molybdate transport systems ATPase subunit
MLRIDVAKKLRDFTFSARMDLPAGVTAIVGASGSGKTTLLRLVAGLLRPDSGSVELAGRSLSNGRVFVPPYRRDIGFVFSEYALFPHLSVAQNVGYGLRARGYPAATRRRRVTALLERFEIGAFAGRRTNELSSGQRQRVALARALAFEPKALLLDEPLSALDPQTRDRVRGELRDILADLTIPTLLVTHDEADRGAFSQRVLRLAAGRIVQDAD